MGRSRLCRAATAVGFLGLGALVVLGWASDDVSTPAALAATALFAATLLVFGWWVLDDWLLSREANADRAPVDHPPSTHRPIEVGRLVLTRGPGARSGLGATLLMLAHERTIDLDGIDSLRFVLRIPAGARGRIEGEDEILDELREVAPARSDVELTGPPLPPMDWGKRDERILAAVQVRLVEEGVLRARWWGLAALPPLAIVPLIFGGGGWLVLGILGGIALGAVVLMAAAGYAYTYSRPGRELRRSWLGYARWLRDNSELERVGPPGVVIWGEHLAYATVLGSAPVAARAFSTT